MNKIAAWVLALGLAVPGTAGAFSFGTFVAGDKIASIVLAPGGPAPPIVKFTTAGNQLQFDAYVATINMTSGTIYNIAAGDVLYSSTLMITGAPFYGFPPYGNGEFVRAYFTNGFTSDFSITDLAGGSTLLVEGDYSAPLEWKATQGLATLVSGSMNGGFVQTGGDAAFLAAAINLSKFNAFHTGFTSGGSAVTNLCGLVNITCPNIGVPSDFKNWEANPNMTISVPEPGMVALLGLGVSGLALIGRRRS